MDFVLKCWCDQAFTMYYCIFGVNRVREFLINCDIILIFWGVLWLQRVSCPLPLFFYLYFPPCSFPCHLLRRDPPFRHSDFHISLSFYVSHLSAGWVDFPVHHRELHPQSAAFICLSHLCSLSLPLSLFLPSYDWVLMIFISACIGSKLNFVSAF